MESLLRDSHEDDEIEGEEIPEYFECSVCLDLFYKPVVLACGHIACFWCIFKCMDNLNQSHCMVCRYAYGHFPRVCMLLHYLLLKLYPISYYRREKQVSEEEKELGHVSPQFDDYLSEMRVIKEIKSPTSTANATKSGPLDEGGPSTSGIASKSTVSEDAKTNLFHGTNCETTSEVAIQENADKGDRITDGDRNRVLSTDLLCTLCKQLLCRPVVLNCGDVFCETCIIGPGDEVPRCPVCHSAHPTGFPNVCLVLDCFLGNHFPKEYEVRKQSLAKQKDDKRVNQSTSTQKNEAEASWGYSMPLNVYAPWFSGQGPKVHFGVGCDYCGMFPIAGERYKCKDCVEKIGFDLCEQCYKSSSKLPGRFNQQHTEDHKFELIEPIHLTELILSPESFEDDGSDDPEDTQEISQAPVASENAEVEVDAEDVEMVPSSNDT